MDWWRAKLILIAAFLCLDLFLARQVWTLRGFSASTAPPAAEASRVGLGTEQLPELKVTTVGWQEGWLSVLTDYQCTPQVADGLGGRLTSPSIQCTSPVDGAQLNWYNGLLIYTNDRSYKSRSAAEEEARQVIEDIDPSAMLPGMQLSQVSFDQTTQTRTFVVIERYDNDLPLFNARWTITAGPRGFKAQRWWIQVESLLPSPQPIIGPSHAVAAVSSLYGQQAASIAPAELGYYYSHPQPPALPTVSNTSISGAAPGSAPAPFWYVKPVYRVHVGQNECVYVDAWGGVPVDGMDNDC